MAEQAEIVSLILPLDLSVSSSDGVSDESASSLASTRYSDDGSSMAANFQAVWRW